MNKRSQRPVVPAVQPVVNRLEREGEREPFVSGRCYKERFEGVFLLCFFYAASKPLPCCRGNLGVARVRAARWDNLPGADPEHVRTIHFIEHHCRVLPFRVSVVAAILRAHLHNGPASCALLDLHLKCGPYAPAALLGGAHKPLLHEKRREQRWVVADVLQQIMLLLVLLHRVQVHTKVGYARVAANIICARRCHVRDLPHNAAHVRWDELHRERQARAGDGKIL